jgi:hypothetical protein
MDILYSAADGQNHSMSRWYLDVLRQQGHNVHFLTTPNTGTKRDRGEVPALGYAHGTHLSDLLQQPDMPAEVFWYVEQRGLIPLGMEDAPFPTVCILNDMHRNLGHRLRLARFFDYVISQQANYVAAFDEHPPENVIWLPYACDTSVFYPHDIPRDLDLAFIGQHHTDERRRIIPQLAQQYTMNEQRVYLMEEIPEVYSRARIVVNLPIGDDLNMRFFEALSCGALLITRRHNTGQEKLFEEGKHYEAFSTEEELLQKVAYYLAHEDERAAIARRGYDEVQQNHRLGLRTQQIIEAVTQQPRLEAPIRKMTPTQRDKQYAWLFEYFRSVEGGLTAMAYARMAGRPWLPLLLPVGRTLLRYLRYDHFAFGGLPQQITPAERTTPIHPQ